MLACVSAIVVQQQPDIRHAVQQGWLRVLGTFIGAVVAYVYLVNFRFSPAGMVVAVVLEEVICMMFKVPDNGKMATITLIIVLIVSERSPDLSPLANGLLRFSEATVGAVVGIAAVWPVDRYRRWRQASAASSPKEYSERSRIPGSRSRADIRRLPAICNSSTTMRPSAQATAR